MYWVQIARQIIFNRSTDNINYKRRVIYIGHITYTKHGNINIPYLFFVSVADAYSTKKFRVRWRSSLFSFDLSSVFSFYLCYLSWQLYWSSFNFSFLCLSSCRSYMIIVLYFLLAIPVIFFCLSHCSTTTYMILKILDIISQNDISSNHEFLLQFLFLYLPTYIL